MRIALLADIHANRQAFEACLAGAQRHGAHRFALVGDYVGYGADPAWAVTTVMDLVGRGAVAVLGNHDSAVNRDDKRLAAAPLQMCRVCPWPVPGLTQPAPPMTMPPKSRRTPRA